MDEPPSFCEGVMGLSPVQADARSAARRALVTKRDCRLSGFAMPRTASGASCGVLPLRRDARSCGGFLGWRPDRTAANDLGSGSEPRWRPGERGGYSPAVAPWLCAPAFRRVCSEQRVRDVAGGCPAPGVGATAGPYAASSAKSLWDKGLRTNSRSPAGWHRPPRWLRLACARYFLPALFQRTL